MKKLLTSLLCASLLLCGFLTSCKKEEAKEKKKEEAVVEEKEELSVPEIPFEFSVDNEFGVATITKYTGKGETVVSIPSTVSVIVSVKLTKEEIAALEAEEATKDNKSAGKASVNTKKSSKTPTKKVIQDFEVVAIADGAFFANKTVESVVIPEGIETIGLATFQNCKALKSVILPESLTSVGARAFYGCEALCELNIGPNVNSIGYMAFSDIFFECPWYASLTDKAVIVGDGILLKYNGTQDVSFGEEVKHVAYYAFLSNPVKNISFSSSLETVDSAAFFDSNPTVTIPSGCAATDDLIATRVAYKVA